MRSIIPPMNKNSSSTQLTKSILVGLLGNVGSISMYLEHQSLTPQTINNLSKPPTRQSRLTRAWLLRSAGLIACTLGCQLFDVPKSLAAGVTVSGQVFSDVNSNGLIETGDLGIAGVTVVLRNTTTSICQSISTDSSGNYSFTSVLAGSYEIIEAGDQLNPTCTPAAGKTLAQTIGKDPTNYASTTSNVIPITVSTSDVTAKNFGDHSARSFTSCPNPAYITKGTGNTTIRLNSVNLSTGVLTEISSANFSAGINGVGFSLADAYIYGSASSGPPFNLARTNLDGTIEYLGAVLDINGANPLQNTSFVGDVDQNGIFYSVHSTTVTAIDVNPNSPTFKRYLKQFTLSSNPSIQDIAISPIDGKVYTVNNSSTSRLYRYPDFSTVSNGGTATIEDLGELRDMATNATMASGPKGAIYFAADGTLYAYRNGNSGSTDGAIYALSTTNIATIPKFTTITSTAPGVGSNDGARCMFAPAIPLPNTYTVSGTLYKDINNNGANNSEPGLGANVTVSIYDDKDGDNIIDANEQITTTTSDANGLYTLSNLVAGPYNYKIKVDTSDVDIPSNYSLSTSNNLAVTVSTANITGRDFGFLPIEVVGFKSAKLTDSNNDTKINPGETVAWTIDYVNTGLVDVTNFQITDILPTGVTKSGTVTVSIGGIGQNLPIANPSYTGTNANPGTTDKLFITPIILKAGGTIKVTIPVTVGSGITGILANQATATADNLPLIGIKTDNAGVTADLPTNIQNSPYSITVPTGSVSQTITTAIDLTTITVEAVAVVTPFRERINSCGVIDFNSDSEGFRAATITYGGSSNPSLYNSFTISPQSAPFTNSSGTFNWQSSGNPGGSLFTNDLDVQWTIFTTPDFGTDTNFSFLTNKSFTFDYKNDTGISGDYDFWVALVGKNGQKVFYSFKAQLSNASTTAFSKVVVPMNASQWFTTFQSPTSAAPTSTAFADILANLDRIDIAAEGRDGPDLTELDSVGMACDRGDAPNTYRTTNSSNAPTHQISATIKLGNKLDAENDGQPTPNADGDDQDLSASNRIGIVDDEDGISSFPRLTAGATSYSIPTANVSATGTGTLSAWIDFNEDGVFSAAEYTSVSVTNGTLSGPLNWNGISIGSVGQTFARFRFTSSILIDNTATTNIDERAFGLATDGEVEDYAVTISAVVASSPNLLLVKRITAINGLPRKFSGASLADYEHVDAYDNNFISIPTRLLPTDPQKDTDKWPDTISTSETNTTSTFLLGASNGGQVKPSDSIEYTIYFLSAGDSPANNVLFCDRVPANVTFSPNTFTNTTTNPGGIARGIAFQLGNAPISYYTNTGDSDNGRYFPPGIEPSTVYQNISCGKNITTGLALPNDNGAVVVNLGNRPNATGILADDQAAGAYGFVRFRGQVK
jgi:uncharacterized repeat protein (TIGR01451 family)